MWYLQLFVIKAIEEKFNVGIKKGIIWYMQGFGKIVLVYYNIYFFMDYFQQQNIIFKFYFIVDWLDLFM